MMVFITSVLHLATPAWGVFQDSIFDSEPDGYVYKVHGTPKDVEAIGPGAPIMGEAAFQIVALINGDDEAGVIAAGSAIKNSFEWTDRGANRWGDVWGIKREAEISFVEPIRSGQRRQVVGGIYRMWARGKQP